jgi:hypothetical protein
VLSKVHAYSGNFHISVTGCASSIAAFCYERLGNNILSVKETPNFIPNEFGVYGIVRVIKIMIEHGYAAQAINAPKERRAVA